MFAAVNVVLGGELADRAEPGRLPSQASKPRLVVRPQAAGAVNLCKMGGEMRRNAARAAAPLECCIRWGFSVRTHEPAGAAWLLRRGKLTWAAADMNALRPTRTLATRLVGCRNSRQRSLWRWARVR